MACQGALQAVPKTGSDSPKEAKYHMGRERFRAESKVKLELRVRWEMPAGAEGALLCRGDPVFRGVVRASPCACIVASSCAAYPMQARTPWIPAILLAPE